MISTYEYNGVMGNFVVDDAGRIAIDQIADAAQPRLTTDYYETVDQALAEFMAMVDRSIATN